MDCSECPQTAEALCFCLKIFLCSFHVGIHFIKPGLHRCESLNCFLSEKESKILQEKVSGTLTDFYLIREHLSSETKKLIKSVEKIQFSEIIKFEKLFLLPESTFINFDFIRKNIILEAKLLIKTLEKLQYLAIFKLENLTKILINVSRRKKFCVSEIQEIKKIIQSSMNFGFSTELNLKHNFEVIFSQNFCTGNHEDESWIKFFDFQNNLNLNLKIDAEYINMKNKNLFDEFDKCEGLNNYFSNILQLDLNKLMAICQNCEIEGIVYKRECSHDWCQNCWHNACNLCQPCNYCKNYSHCVFKPCSHKFCANCFSYPCPYCCQSHNTLLTIPDCSHPFCSLCINANYCTICHPDISKQQVYSEQLSEAKTEITSAAKSEWDGYEIIPNEENKIESTEELSDDEDKDYKILGANNVIKRDPNTLDIKPIKLSESNKVEECKSVFFDNKKTICENCGEFGKKKRFECNHYGCEDCIFNQPCKICLNRTKNCINCTGVAQTKALLGCGHEACLKCLDKKCKFCENFQSKCNNCNKKDFLKKKLNYLNQPCGHFYCFKCISKMESCPLCQLAQKSKPFCIHTQAGPCKSCNYKCEICKDFLKNCKNCNDNTYFCENPACYNHTCKICKNIFNSCSNCNKKAETTKCAYCFKFICMECKNSHICQKLNCLSCGQFIKASTSLCSHTFCESCFVGSNKTCSFCHPSEVKCDTCQLPGFKKMIFDCKHLGCSNCFKNNGCYDCVFKNRLYKPVEYQMCQCCSCKGKTKEGFNLLCDHFVCKNCSKLDWSCLNFNCIECIFIKENNKVCIECKKDFNIKLKNDFIIKACCQYRICKKHVCKIIKDGCLNCYELNIRNNS